MTIAVRINDQSYQERSLQLAQDLTLPILGDDADAKKFDYALEYVDDVLQLVSTHKKHGPVFCDFTSGAFLHRLKYGGKLSQPLAKAVGLKKLKSNQSLSVLDTTAGLGTDAMLLAAWGCEVTLLERDKVVASLLADGLSRAKNKLNDEFDFSKIHFEQIDALDYLKCSTKQFDVVYLDPMFKLEKQKAKPNKNMQVLQDILPQENDAEDALLVLAKSHAKNRVVVKRSSMSKTINSLNLSFSIDGQANRFDVYLSE